MNNTISSRLSLRVALVVFFFVLHLSTATAATALGAENNINPAQTATLLQSLQNLLQQLGELFTVPARAASEFFVSPSGLSTNAGTSASPWDLQTALKHPAAVKPGDTIWLAGGRYQTTDTLGFQSYLSGTATQPIHVRCAPGARCILVAPTRSHPTVEATLNILGSYTWYWDLEVTSDRTDRIGDWGPDGQEGTADDDPVGQNGRPGIFHSGKSNKIINLHSYDNSEGIKPQSQGTDLELYWANIRHNGVDLPDRGHGHGVYGQNAAPSFLTIEHSVFWPGYGGGVHLYGSAAAKLENFRFLNNVMFGNTGRGGGTDNAVGFVDFVIGGTTGATLKDSIVQGNVTYEVGNNLGYYTGGAMASKDHGCWRITVKDNYFVRTSRWHPTSVAGLSTVNHCAAGFLGVGPMQWTFGGQTVTQDRGGAMTGNTFIGPARDFGPDESVSWRKAPGNVFQKTFPTADRVFVHHHKYDSSKHRLTVFNWDKSATQSFDLAALGIATVGQSYELRSAQNPFGPAILADTYGGGSVTVAMTGHPIEPARGAVEVQKDTGPDFQVFDIIVGAGLPFPSPPLPAPSPLPPPTPPPVIPPPAPPSPSPATLAITLAATPNPVAANINTNFTADVSGTAFGTINYSVWWNCNNISANASTVATACGTLPSPATGSCASNTAGYKCNAVTTDPKTFSYAYVTQGTYTAKVIAERGTAPASEARTTVMVNAQSPPADTAQPVISGVSTSNILASAATVNWTTNEPANTQVEYGATTNYGNSTVLNTNLATSHVQALSGLSANTLYHYRARSRDAAGNIAISGDFTFTTPPTQPPSPPSPTPPTPTSPSPAPPPSPSPFPAPPSPPTSPPQPPTPSPVITVGGRIQATFDLNVLQMPSLYSALLGDQPVGANGTVVSGPIIASGYYWWEINYDSGPDGWSVEDDLTTTSSPAPPPSPTQSPTPAPVPSPEPYSPSPLSPPVSSDGSGGDVPPPPTAHMSAPMPLPTPLSPPSAAPAAPHTFTRTMFYGNIGDEAIHLQKILKSLGFFPANTETAPIFGRVTERAVMQFQISKNLPSTGVLNLATRTALNELVIKNEVTLSPATPPIMSPSTSSAPVLLTRNLFRGLSHSEVTVLQALLVKEGVYPEGIISGYFGVLTEKAIQRFQIKYQIVISGTPLTTGFGTVGPRTRTKINALLNETAR